MRKMLSEQLHERAAAMRKEAAELDRYRKGDTYGEWGARQDRAKLLRRQAGVVLRQARAAAKREGRG